MNTPKLFERVRDGVVIGYAFYCPGCDRGHWFEVPRWSFNGNMERPTFSPSLLNYHTLPKTDQRIVDCHLFLKDGRIEFCGDCPHPLKGQTVEMVDWPEGYGHG